jgi:hypothetical protein
VATRKKPAPAKKAATKRAPTKRIRAGVATGAAEQSGFSQKVARRTEANLSDRMKRDRDVFVTEYLCDFNAGNAWRRMKATCYPDDPLTMSQEVKASDYGYELTREPYVAFKIKEAIDALEEDQLINRKRILSGLVREANYHGVGASHSARVGSYGKLASILGMDNHKLEATLALRGGVMIVPQVESEETWEERAAKAQAALKEEVRK